MLLFSAKNNRFKIQRFPPFTDGRKVTPTPTNRRAFKLALGHGAAAFTQPPFHNLLSLIYRALRPSIRGGYKQKMPRQCGKTLFGAREHLNVVGYHRNIIPNSSDSCKSNRRYFFMKMRITYPGCQIEFERPDYTGEDFSTRCWSMFCCVLAVCCCVVLVALFL